MSSEPTNEQPHLLRPHAAVAARVLCPGDPGRALRLAQDLTDGVPRMLNHHRGLWGYSGTAIDGDELTVQGTGIGGPGAAVVIADLIALGARRIVRVGSATAVDPGLALGALVVADRVLARDGTSRALGAGEHVTPDRALTEALARGADATGTVASADVWLRHGGTPAHGDASPSGDDGVALAQDLQTAALLTAAMREGAVAAAVLLIAEDAAGRRIPEEERLAAELRAGRLALSALAGPAA